MKDVVKEIYAKVKLQEGPGIIEQMLIECYMNPGISTKELARRQMLPIPVAAAIKKELIRARILKQDRGVDCTSTGRRCIEQAGGYQDIDRSLYRRFMREGLELQELTQEREWHGWREIFNTRPQVNVQIDQSKCTPETSLRRAILALRNHAVIGKRILCVGDDDLVSVSLGFLLKQLFPGSSEAKAEIEVVDIDDRFLDYIRMIAERENLPITCRLVDLREPLPSDLCGQFDAFFTDPPYTLQGASLFLSRGISALRKEKGLPIFLSFAHKSPDFMLAMQREFVRMGLTVGSTLLHFNEYEGAEMIANRSQMMILKTTDHTAPEYTDSFTDALYTGEVKRTRRTYCCLQCTEIIRVGMDGEYQTIEALKNAGCPSCSNSTFKLMSKEEI
ncbi:bis-aminopropyl spermidine synthase family protein [Paenibacillus ihumii]|uniref:bis-aminopropyl spermidine synthase family protein n=1 Tax=Paenibacillus ihumii TaxID=687436 RepID=UPI0006D77EA0|nr:bis-aminopropyl spermidine synthase family protein [Paenibacillus ihumii]